MSDHLHRYEVRTTWTGNTGEGTSHYRAYRRDHEIAGKDKTASIPCSSDPVFRGDRSRYNPEELLLSAVSACHMLWMLHLCADAGIVVTSYEDPATAKVTMHPDGAGQFSEATLHPRMVITDPARIGDANALHHRAHKLCAIARSVNFPVQIDPTTVAAT